MAKCLSSFFTVFFKTKKRKLNETLEKDAIGLEDEYDELGGISICDSSIYNGNYAISPAHALGVEGGAELNSYASQWIQQQVSGITSQQLQQSPHYQQQMLDSGNNVTILSENEDDIFDILASQNPNHTHHHKRNVSNASEVTAVVTTDDGVSVSSLDTTSDFFSDLRIRQQQRSTIQPTSPSTLLLLGPHGRDGDDDDVYDEEVEESLYSSSTIDPASLLGKPRAGTGAGGNIFVKHRRHNDGGEYDDGCSDISREELFTHDSGSVSSGSEEMNTNHLLTTIGNIHISEIHHEPVVDNDKNRRMRSTAVRSYKEGRDSKSFDTDCITETTTDITESGEVSEIML